VGIRAEQAELVEQLTGAGIAATDDPARAETSRPCVLVTPPTVDYRACSSSWRLVALSSHPAGTLAAVEQLDQLVTEVAELLPLDTAEPASYSLTPATDPLPAYVLRLTT
jgi:hypothetical protein